MLSAAEYKSVRLELRSLIKRAQCLFGFDH